MSTEQYTKLMADMGISRGALEVDGEIDATPSGGQIKTFKQRSLLKPESSTVPEKPPLSESEEVPEHLKCNNPAAQQAGKWWAKMTPEERAIHSQKRAESGRKSWKSRKPALT